MVEVEFAPALQRHVTAPVLRLEGASLRGVLEGALDRVPALRDYVLDEQGAVRKHVAIFVNGELQHDRATLARTLSADDRIYIAQALSGG